jgi:hypothetical protein
MKHTTSQKYVCTTVQEVNTATDRLSKAHEVKLQLIDGGITKEINNFKGIYNSTLGEFCAAVSNRYNVISHKEYFDCFGEAMNRLNIKFNMTVKEQGNQAFADIEFIGRNIKFDKLNEEFITGIRLSNSYNRTQGLGVAPRFTRLACTNGMILTHSEKTFSIRHHSKMAKEIESFVEIRLNDIINKDELLQNWVSQSMVDSVEWETVTKILPKLFSQAKHREEILKRLGVSVIEKKKGHKVIGYSYVLETDKESKIDRWKLYNSITEYLSHGEHITPLLENSLHKQAEKVLTTSFKRLPRMIEVTI